MNTDYCNVNVMMNGNYFDITHSFKVGSSTYHVLGLRKDRPTYGNTYYIFNCTDNDSELAQCSSRTLPFIHHSKKSVHQSYKTAHTSRSVVREQSINQRNGTSSAREQNRVRTASQKNVTRDDTVIKQELIDILKTEHQSLVASFRKEINTEKSTLLRSIEKETETFTKVTKIATNEKQEILRRLEEKINTLQSTYERYATSTVSSIELLKTTVTETLNTQHVQSQSIDHIQITLGKMIEQEVEKIMVRYLDIYKSTFIDINAINQLRTTLIETFEKRSTTTRNNKDDNNDSLKYLLAEQTQHLTDLITKHQQTYILDSNTIKQLQNTLIEAVQKYSITKTDNNNTDVLNRLFAEQRQYLTELITKQQQVSSLDLIRQTIVATLKEQTSTVITTTNSIGVTHDLRPFKISIKTAEYARVFAKLLVVGERNPLENHTLCQRDPFQADVVNCFVAPPIGNKPFELTVYAKTDSESEYRAALSIQMPYPNIAQPITFPHVDEPFREHKCILIEPLRRKLKPNEQVLIHMVLPSIREVKIRNGDDYIELSRDEFRNGFIKKNIQVRGKVIVSGLWNTRNAEDICSFEMDEN